MASRRLAISFLCDDGSSATQPPTSSSPSHPVPPAPGSGSDSPAYAQQVRPDYPQYFRGGQDALEHTGNALAYSNHPCDLASSHFAGSSRTQTASLRHLGGPASPPMADTPVIVSPVLERRSVPQSYSSDRTDGEWEASRLSRSTHSAVRPFESTPYIREEVHHYSSHSLHQYSYPAPPANFPTSSYPAHSRPGSSSSAAPSTSRSPVTSYRYSQSPEQLRLSPLRSPVIPYTSLQSRPSMSPTHAPTAETTSPPHYYYGQTQMARVPLSIQTYQTSSGPFTSDSAQSSSYPYAQTHATQQSQVKSASSYAPAMSPSFSRAHMESPLSGLDVLVQAATEERRRLSAGSESGAVSAIRTSLSPVADRSALHDRVAYQESAQPQYPQTYRLQSPVIPESVRNLDVEPPRKRRRSSGSPPPCVSHDHQLHIETMSPLLEEPKEHSVAVERPPSARPSPINDEPVKMEPQPKPVENPSRPPTPVPEGEQDAHEWLMEQYGASSRSSVSPFPSPRISPASAREGRMSESWLAPTQFLSTPAELSAAVTPAPPKLLSKKSSPSTPTRVLEEALDYAEPIKREVSVPPDLDVDRDLLGLVDEPSAGPSTSYLDVEDELLSLVDGHKDKRPLSSRSSPEVYRRKNVPSPTLHMIHEHPPAFPSTHKRSASRTLPSASVHERDLMPPPSTVGTSSSSKDTAPAAKSPNKKDEGPKATVANVASAPSPTKKKAATAASKSKPPPKPKKKASGTNTKSRVKALQDEEAASTLSRSKKAASSAAGAKSRAKSGSAARSRSTSVLPGRPGSVVPEAEVAGREDEELPGDDDEHAAKVNDDKLYCICKTKYDEDRVMIACDRCDEWYHTQCVNMPDLEVDLVDTFICPPCVKSNPHLTLHTTYKRRCFAGLQHPNPSSTSACHKSARGVLSKYCSDECGVKHMRRRIDAWAAGGGSTRQLWNNVKSAERREGVVIRVDAADQWKTDPAAFIEAADSNVKNDREVERLRRQLDKVMKAREQLKKEMEVVIWRQKLVELASDRADRVDECGWDQRLCFDDGEWAEFGAGVLESYEETLEDAGHESESGMQIDGPVAEHGEWWCKGKKKCDRHAGWQKLRIAEADFDKETKEATIAKLTSQERELRKRIEDILEPKGGKLASTLSLKSSTKPAANGHVSAIMKSNGDLSKKGKKRKAEAI
ncbi:hypothetical protein NEOLEDRAFT_1125965 [Neolentinus lepideus HHB14362 ss-1]|uniref:PHD-type domain-containing protein n=1 Tax=Neolentinus lepideus HHB14362 ss-1 TaxID=1314782 RepID=A0A165VZ89_9AGAM|nr:hypothetical protein NEOLEDRAFT_1125965 [Neolentinus lepideus HHB14362 ss-1]